MHTEKGRLRIHFKERCKTFFKLKYIEIRKGRRRRSEKQVGVTFVGDQIVRGCSGSAYGAGGQSIESDPYTDDLHDTYTYIGRYIK